MSDRRVLHTQRDVDLWCRFLSKATLPITVSWKQGGDRSLDQNALSHKWFAEIAGHFGDRTPHDVRLEMKLTKGVPILRENDDFREFYDKALKPLPYDMKLRAMEYVPVTSIMTTKEMTRFLDEVFRHWSEQGVKLTIPEDGE